MDTKTVYPQGMKETVQTKPEKITPFQLALLVLSILVLLALVLDTLVPLHREVSTIIQTLDTVVCVLFFTDFIVRFRRAESKREFMRWGWIDLLACIPNVDLLRFGRMVRVLRIIRLLRGIRVGQRVISVLLQNKPKSAFASVMLTTILLVTFSSIAVLIAEQGPESNIKSADDAIWWSVTTITTVGYGDRYPTSIEGRVIAMVLMLSGVGLFGTLSGLVASLFLGSRQDESAELKEILHRLQQLDARLMASPPSQSLSAQNPNRDEPRMDPLGSVTP
jgi:voltage-gated potassium channel